MERNDSLTLIYARVFVIVIIGIIVCRLFYLQVLDDSYKRYSDRNSVREIVRYPIRGEIFDRNGVMIAQNREAYDLMIVPRELEEFDTLRLANIIGMELPALVERINKTKSYSMRKESALVSQLPHKTKLMIEELSIPGLSFAAHPVRNYPFKSVGNVFGYLGEISPDELSRDSHYIGGDYVGKAGLEMTYERELRGEKGYFYKQVDVHGVVRGDFDEGKQDVTPVAGRRITSTLDIKLQELGHRLMQGKVGSIVAIEPSTGEVLAMVTAPTYHPDSLVGIEMGANYRKLSQNPRRPLFNRAVMGGYPPGSTFKMANALIGLQENLVTTTEKFDCNQGWSVPGRRVKCHYHASPVDMQFAIQTSCNAYFCYLFRRMLHSEKYGGVKNGFNVWSNIIKSFGFGVTLDTDIAGVQRGFIPDASFYDRMYGRYWNAVTVISLSIGQGEITASPLQIANFTSVIANRGYYHMPHLVKDMDDGLSNDMVARNSQKHYCDIDAAHFDPIVDAMWKGVNVYGTGTSNSELIRDLNICGKSGTAQNGKGADHSTYVAFAPKDNPKIAIAVYVEYGGWGNTAGLPIATLMIEQYLKDTILRTDLLEKIEQLVIDYPEYDKLLEVKKQPVVGNLMEVKK